ncbi:MAG: DinB family protein [Gemmatimonadales bacterium]
MAVKTLSRQRDKDELLRRLQTVHPDTAPRWGRMSAHQMVCHLSDALLMATGERAVSAATGVRARALIKWIALYAPLPWPAGIPTSAETDQERGGTRPVDFQSDLAQVRALVERVARRAGAGSWPVHPVFGRMSEADWLRWAYVHTDHHLRQFKA